MEEVTIKNYQELAMRTCLPSAKNWEYCYCLIASEIGEAFGKWGKKFRDGSFDKEKLTDELGDVFWGVALACELGGHNFAELLEESYVRDYLDLGFYSPKRFFTRQPKILFEWEICDYMSFVKTLAGQCGIDPLECLKRNIAKLAGRQERGTLTGNGDER